MDQNQPISHGLSVSKTLTDRPSSFTTDTGSPSLQRKRKDSISSLSSGADSEFSDRPPVDLYAEEGELSEDPDCTVNERHLLDPAPAEEQTYRESMHGIRLYIGWSNIPDMDSATTGSDDNPFSGHRQGVGTNAYRGLALQKDW